MSTNDGPAANPMAAPGATSEGSYNVSRTNATPDEVDAIARRVAARNATVAPPAGNKPGSYHYPKDQAEAVSAGTVPLPDEPRKRVSVFEPGPDGLVPGTMGRVPLGHPDALLTVDEAGEYQRNES